MAASRLLWTAHPHGLPNVAGLGISFPFGKSPPSSSAPAPPSTLSLGWHAVSIEAIAELTGLIERREIESVPPFLHEAFRKFRGEGEQAPEVTAAAAQGESVELKLRSDTEYLRLALQILKHQASETMPSTRGKRSRAIGRLMHRALSGG
ncbi:hypothetical protein [Rhizobium leucaenae]|uniref:hypothetical protein n=1 Tax=Rhizobiaceae TaxID=82115 RepID=UPI0007EE4FF8|nr:hypothetical protein [Rhizobium leucaenae]